MVKPKFSRTQQKEAEKSLSRDQAKIDELRALTDDALSAKFWGEDSSSKTLADAVELLNGDDREAIVESIAVSEGFVEVRHWGDPMASGPVSDNFSWERDAVELKRETLA